LGHITSGFHLSLLAVSNSSTLGEKLEQKGANDCVHYAQYEHAKFANDEQKNSKEYGLALFLFYVFDWLVGVILCIEESGTNLHGFGQDGT